MRPAPGRIERSWGQMTEAGPSTGVLFRVSGPTQVVSPCSGALEFGEVFRSYGLLLIIDCGGGYHAVLSGLDRLKVGAGHSVRMGETVGVAVGAKGGMRSGVYLEVR